MVPLLWLSWSQGAWFWSQLVLQVSWPEPLVQSVTLPAATCELSSLTGPRVSAVGFAQLKVGSGVGVGDGVGVGVGDGVGVTAGLGVRPGVTVTPGPLIVKISEALRWLTDSEA